MIPSEYAAQSRRRFSEPNFFYQFFEFSNLFSREEIKTTSGQVLPAGRWVTASARNGKEQTGGVQVSQARIPAEPDDKLIVSREP